MRMGLRMKLLRKKAKISQLELSEKMGVPVAAISKYEYGTRSPSIEYIVKFCKYFGVSTDYLLDDDAKLPHASTEPLYKHICNIIDKYKESTTFEIMHTDCSHSDTLDALDEECNAMRYAAAKMIRELFKP